MNIQALIPLIATIAYIPLLVILLLNRPWSRRQRFFFLFLIPAMIWSFSTFLFRSDFFMQDKLLPAKAGICVSIWMLIQFHYFIHSFYQSKHTKIPLAYIFLVSTLVLAVLGYIPQDIEFTAGGITVNYGIWVTVIFLSFLFTLGIKDISSLIRRFKHSSDPVEHNQISYLLIAMGTLIVFLFSSISSIGENYPVSHIGNFLTASILTYSVVAHRLLDVIVALRRMLIWLGAVIGGTAAYVGLIFLAHFTIGFDVNPATVAVTIGITAIAGVVGYKLLGIFHVKVERAFTGEKFDYRRQLSDFTSKIHDVPTLEQFGNQFMSLFSQSIDCQSACLLLPADGNGNFAMRFTYPPTQNNPMLKLKLRNDSPVVIWLKREKKILLQRSLIISPEFQSMWQEEKEAIQSADVEIFAPLINKDELVAIMAVSDKRNGKFYTVEDIDLLESVANRVAASMEKEYSHERLREQDEELTRINRLTTIITSSMSIDEIFQGFADELKKVADIDWTTIALIAGDSIQFSALFSTVGSPWQSGDSIPLKGTATEWVARQKKSIYEPDLALRRRFWTGDYHLKQGIRSIVYLPLIVRDETIGSITIASRRPNIYSPKQIRLLEHVASQIATPVENAQLYIKAEQRSRIDELTWLFNRRHFDERFKEEIDRHSRHGNVLSLLLLDLDHFKTHNDIYGHPSGDELLKQIGRIIRSSIRSADQAFRYGGDEFTVILPQTDPNDAYMVAERLREQILFEMEAKEIGVTGSIGLASYPLDGVMPGELVTAADTALYYVKRTGGNRTYLSSKVLSEPSPTAGINTKSSGLSAVYALASAVEAKDTHTYGHSRKVTTYAVAIAEAIGLSPDEVSTVSTSALLHDIGKIGISDTILNKKEKLNAGDWEAIKAHPRLGANIVSNVPALAPCVPAILYHHERYDGTGYPEGLKGENIPLEGRILAIADAFSAMVSSRPYRDALPDEKAIKELKEGAGTQFDPKLVEVFIGIVKAGLPEKTQVS